jgi:hypothetical protein
VTEFEKHLEGIQQSSNVAKETITRLKLMENSAEVVLCMDVSDQMEDYLITGKAQVIADRILAFATNMDIDSHIDLFLFAERAFFIGSMDLSNFQNYIQDAMKQYNFSGRADYINVINLIRTTYLKNAKREGKLAVRETPVYVYFISNGETDDNDEILKTISNASYEPIFWEFMTMGTTKSDLEKGIMGWLMRPFVDDYSFLEQLDDMEGRFIDNADFFNVNDPRIMDDAEFYGLMMAEFPDWLKEAKIKGLVKSNVN